MMRLTTAPTCDRRLGQGAWEGGRFTRTCDRCPQRFETAPRRKTTLCPDCQYLERYERRLPLMQRAVDMRDEGLDAKEIGAELGYSAHTIREWWREVGV